MNNERHKKIKPKVIIAANDAGGAEVIAGYVKHYRERYDFHPYVAGPAERIFTREGISFEKAPRSKKKIKEILALEKDAKFILVGTGWMTSIERDFLFFAKKAQFNSAAYLDSWVNYRERFGYPKKGWKQNLPNEIWVGDKSALALARRFFSKKDAKIRLVPNEYFRVAKKRFAQIIRNKNKTKGILFVSDLRIPNTKGILHQTIKYLADTGYMHPITIRLHPAESRHRHDRLVKKFKTKLALSLSHNGDLLEDIANSHVVIGMESMALVIALLCGKKVVSMLSRGEKNNAQVLPFSKITRLKNVDELGAYLGRQK